MAALPGVYEVAAHAQYTVAKSGASDDAINRRSLVPSPSIGSLVPTSENRT